MLRFLLGFLFINIIFTISAFSQGLTVSVTGVTAINAGSTYTYNVVWKENGVVRSAPVGGTHTWQVYGGTAHSSGSNYAAIQWTNSSGAIVYQYIYLGTTYTANLTVGSGSCALIPSVTFSISPSTCAPRQLSYTGAPPAGVIWYWQTSSTGTSTSNSSSIYSVTSPGTFYVRPYNTTTSCWGTDASQYGVSNVTPSPAQPDSPIVSTDLCGSKALMHNSPPAGVTWYWQGTNPNGTSTSNSGTDLAFTTGVYFLRAQDNASGCWSTSSSSASVVVNDWPSAPTAPVTTSNSCGPQTLSKVGLPPAGITWYWQGTNSNGTDFTSGDATGATYSTPTSGTYYLRAKHSNGCWSQGAASVVVTVNPIPPNPASPNASTNTCGEKTLTFVGSPPSGVTWYWQGTNPNGTSISNSLNTAMGPADGTYYLRAKNNEGGCWSTNSSSVQVFVNSLPVAPAVPAVSSNCGPRTLSKVGSPSGGASWYWQGTNSNGMDNTSAVATAATYSADNSGTYYLRAFKMNSGGGCWSDPSSVVVTINSPPATPGDPIVLPNNCGSKPLQHGSSPSGITWYWQGTNPNGFSQSNSGTDLAFTTGTYYLRAIDNSTGCWSANSSSAYVVINVPPTATAPTTTAYWCGPQTLSKSGTPPENINWYWQGKIQDGTDDSSLAATASTYSATSSGTYYLRPRSSNGCWGISSSVPVSVYIPPTPSVPQGLEISEITVSSFSIQWSIVSGADNYIAEVAMDNAFASIIETSTNANAFRIFTGLKGGKTYFFRVRALRECVSSDYSTVISVPIPNDYNYIITKDVMKQGLHSESDVINATVSDVRIKYDYFDGIGRPAQSISMQSSPLGLDIVQPIVYDQFGREDVKYLPYVSTSTNAHYQYTALGDQQQFYANGSMDKIIDDAFPYAVSKVEKSPLNRVVEQGSAGLAWQPDGVDSYISPDKTIKKAYGTNTTNEVLLWTYTPPTVTYPLGLVNTTITAAPTTPVYYNANQLYKNKTKDEQDNEVIEYIDKEGHTILKRVQAVSGTPEVNDVNYAATYYIYDVFGNLVTVIPPEATRLLLTLYYKSGASDASKNTFLNLWAFRYVYDSRSRMTQRQVPGAGPVYMVYDSRDRLVLTQDANQRSTSTDYWTFTKYDEQNRPILTGIKDTVDNISQAAMQNSVDQFYAAMAAKPWRKWGEKYIGNTIGNIHGYSNDSYPEVTTSASVSANDYLTVTYYDHYNFKTEWPDGYSYVNDNLSNTANGVTYNQQGTAFTNVKGLVTGTMVKILDGGVRGGYSWLPSVNYYDDKYRVIQTIAKNHTSALERSTNLYDFTGKILTTKTEHSVMWKDLTGVESTATSLTKRFPSNSWGNAGAASMAKLPAGQDGWMETVVSETTTFRMIGLSDVNVDADYTGIDYAFYLSGGLLYVRENGVSKGQIAGGISSGTILRIERTGTTMRYYRDGALKYTSAVPSSTSLLIDAALYSDGSTLAGIRTSFIPDEKTIVRRFEYDHTGRLLATWHKVGTAPEILLAKNEYNELGQLVDKKLHSTNVDGTDAKQSLDYRYNIRGWLTSMNNAALSSQTGVNDDTGDLFGFELGYNNDLGFGNQGLFNGNISGMKWSSNLGLSDKKMNAYTFAYDPMNRLMKAEFSEKSVAWTPSAAFNEDNLQYDLNGNIQSLSRKENGLVIDQLTYAYGTGTVQSNKLLKVSDAGNASKGFTELAAGNGGSVNDYEYDANGNLLWDRNKGGAEFLSNGSFDNSNSGWTITGVSQRFAFGSGQLAVASGAGTAEIYVSSGIVPGKPYVVSIDIEKTSVIGNLLMRVGNELVTITSTGVQTFAVTAGGADSFRLTFEAGWAGTVRSVSVKGIAVINYNHLNLPTLVTMPGDKQLKYIYDATGRKLYQQLEKSTGLVLKRTDYLGEFFYENDTLKFINHEEGRVVMTGTEPEYQYHLKDHLGNVRLTFTAKEEIENDKATLETENASQEQSKFLNHAEAVIVNHEIFDRTSDGATNETYNATRLVGGTTNQKYGLARSLSVMPGDEISMEVWAKYLDLDPDPENWTNAYRSFLQAYSSGTPPSGSVIDGGLAGSIGSGVFPFPTFIMPGSKSEAAPKAYLNWIVCDRNHDPIIGECGFVQIGSTGTLPKENGSNVAHELLKRATPLKINQPGYVYIYLSNENETSVEVFFDDFRVEHKKSPVVQMDDYYPFGLTFNSYSRENSVQQNYLYNGKELQDELNLGWYDYQARQYDPAIGRWMAIDPLADKMRRWSPYNYGFDNPIRFIDPDGMGPNDFVKDKGGNVRWDKNANSQATTKAGETYLGKTLNFEFKSYIDKKLWDGPNPPGGDASGVKLTTKVSITGHENSKGELTDISASKPQVEVGPTPIGTGRDSYPGLGDDQNKSSLTSSANGVNLNVEQHGSVSPIEEAGVNLMGYDIVNVAQKLDVNVSPKGNVSVSAATDVFPSATLTLNGSTIMQYNQPSFKATHTSGGSTFSDNGTGGVTGESSYKPATWYKRK